MNIKEYLTAFHEAQDEDSRLLSRTGKWNSSPPCTMLKNTCSPAYGFWRLAQEIFELHRKADVDALRGHFPVTLLHYVAADGFANHMRQTLDEMDEETFALYLKYHLATCEQVELSGYSNHTLDIFRKD